MACRSLQDFRFGRSQASNISGIYPTRKHHKIYDYVTLIVFGNKTLKSMGKYVMHQQSCAKILNTK